MNAIILLLIILAPSIFLFLKFNKNIEDTIPISIFSTVFIIYVFGLLNILKFGVVFILLGTIVLYFLSIKTMIKDKKIKIVLRNFLRPSFVIWIILYIAIFLFYKNRMLVKWDEFTHWGDVVKMMYNKNIFNTNPLSMSAAKAYPPGMALWQYFLQVINNSKFNEGYLFVSYQIFNISLFLPFIKNLKWRQYYKIIIYPLIMLLIPVLIFPYFYTTIYVDAILGMIFAYTLALIFTTKEYDTFTIIRIGLALFTMILIKDVAVLFAFISWGIIVLDIVFVKKNIIILKKLNKKNIKKFIKKTYPVLIFLLMILLTYISWKINVTINVNVEGTNPSNIKDVIKAILNIENSYRNTVITNYVNALNDYKIFINLNFYCFSSIILLFCYLIHKKEKDKNKSGIVIGTIYIGLVLYIIVMLFLYIMIFSEYEATTLASFDRYIGIYLNALLFFITFVILDRASKNKNKIGFNLLLLSVFIIYHVPLNNFVSMIYNHKQDIQNTIDLRQPYENVYTLLSEKIPKNEKPRVYIIVQNDEGYSKWLIRYTIRELITGVNEGFNWSLGKKYHDGDIWTYDISKKDFEEELYRNYDYIYLFKIDEQFINTYGEIFNSEKLDHNQLYKINKDKKVLELK